MNISELNELFAALGKDDTKAQLKNLSNKELRKLCAAIAFEILEIDVSDQFEDYTQRELIKYAVKNAQENYKGAQKNKKRQRDESESKREKKKAVAQKEAEVDCNFDYGEEDLRIDECWERYLSQIVKSFCENKACDRRDTDGDYEYLGELMEVTRQALIECMSCMPDELKYEQFLTERLQEIENDRLADESWQIMGAGEKTKQQLLEAFNDTRIPSPQSVQQRFPDLYDDYNSALEGLEDAYADEIDFRYREGRHANFYPRRHVEGYIQKARALLLLKRDLNE